MYKVFAWVIGMEMQGLGKIIIIVGIVTVVIGLVITLGGKIGLGRLPGDIFIRREGFSFYFPVVTCILLSIVLTIILNIFFRR